MRKLHLGVVVPVLSAFPQFARCMASIQTDHWWQPYIGPQWEENLAISAVWNNKTKQAFKDDCDFVLVLNDDVCLRPWTVDALIGELEKVPNLYLVSGESTQVMDEEFFADSLIQSNLNFSCFMLKPGIFDVIGYFDENFYPAYFEDNDFHYRMRMLDYPAYGIKQAQFFHEGSVTNQFRVSQSGEQAYADFEACRRYYIKKWGGPPGKEVFKCPYNDNSYNVKEWMHITHE